MARRFSRIAASLLSLLGCSYSPDGGPCENIQIPDGAVANAFMVMFLAASCGGHLADAGNDTDAGVDASDGGLIDAADGGIDASPDAPLMCPDGEVATPTGCQPRPRIMCETLQPGSRRFRVSGLVAYGLGPACTDAQNCGVAQAPGAAPTWIVYGSEFDSAPIQQSCPSADRWVIPYPSGCQGKPAVAWTGTEEDEQDLNLDLSDGVEHLVLAVRYSDGTYRWADFTAMDGDGEGFTVGGSGAGFNCRIVHDHGPPFTDVIKVGP